MLRGYLKVLKKCTVDAIGFWESGLMERVRLAERIHMIACSDEVVYEAM